jgi:hypothetical protein
MTALPGRWSDLLNEVGMRGLESVPSETIQKIVADFERERLRRLKISNEKRLAQQEASQRRLAEEKKALQEQESSMRATMDAERAEKERRMHEWLERVKSKDAQRILDKERMRSLAQSQSKPKPSPAEACPVPWRPARVVTRSSPEEPSIGSPDASKHSPSTSRSAICLYAKFSKDLTGPPDPSRERYKEAMSNSKYAESLKLASSVYSRKLGINT